MFWSKGNKLKRRKFFTLALWWSFFVFFSLIFHYLYLRNRSIYKRQKTTYFHTASHLDWSLFSISLYFYQGVSYECVWMNLIKPGAFDSNIWQCHPLIHCLIPQEDIVLQTPNQYMHLGEHHSLSFILPPFLHSFILWNLFRESFKV